MTIMRKYFTHPYLNYITDYIFHQGRTRTGINKGESKYSITLYHEG